MKTTYETHWFLGSIKEGEHLRAALASAYELANECGMKTTLIAIRDLFTKVPVATFCDGRGSVLIGKDDVDYYEVSDFCLDIKRPNVETELAILWGKEIATCKDEKKKLLMEKMEVGNLRMLLNDWANAIIQNDANPEEFFADKMEEIFGLLI